MLHTKNEDSGGEWWVNSTSSHLCTMKQLVSLSLWPLPYYDDLIRDMDGTPRWLSRYSDTLRAGRFGIESRWGVRLFAPVQTDPGTHPASCTVGTGSFLGVKWAGRGVDQAMGCLFLHYYSGNGLFVSALLFTQWAVCFCITVQAMSCLFLHYCSGNGLFVSALLFRQWAVCFCITVQAIMFYTAHQLRTVVFITSESAVTSRVLTDLFRAIVCLYHKTKYSNFDKLVYFYQRDFSICTYCTSLPACRTPNSVPL